MSVQVIYQGWKTSVMNKKIGNGECVALEVNNPQSYTAALFPGVNWTDIIAPVESAKDTAGKSNTYLTWIENDHNDPNQLPEIGDIMVFDSTPAAGYSNTYPNPDGHMGNYDGPHAGGYVLLQQNAPSFGSTVNTTVYDWKYRPCMGWYRPNVDAPTPPAPQPEGKTLHIAATTNDMHVYPVGGPYTASAAKGMISPHQFGGLSYPIVADRGNGIYTVNTEDYGQGDLYTKGSDVSVS